ncbi:hypothetical protein [Microbacterium sp. JZ101]
MTMRTSFSAPPPHGPDAPLVDEAELDIWGARAVRHASWARELLGRLAAQRGEHLDRESLRYAVTAGPEELAVVWAAGHAVVYVAPDGSVWHADAETVRREDYEDFARGERTPIERFGAPAATGDLARSAVPGLAEDLAARAGLDMLPRRAGVLLAVGDMELEWLIAEEDGVLVAYRVERGSARELARSSDASVAVRAVESSLGLLRD